MTAYVVVYAKIKDPEKLARYSKAASETIDAHGGAFSIRSSIQQVLTGMADYDRFVLIEFPDTASARRWYDSAEYQALIPLRDEAADMLFTLAK